MLARLVLGVGMLALLAGAASAADLRAVTDSAGRRVEVPARVERAAVEVIGFWSRWHRGIFTPRDSDLHMHVRTLDDRMSGHLETIELASGASLWLPPSGGGKDDGT